MSRSGTCRMDSSWIQTSPKRSIFMGTATQLRAVSSLTSVSVADDVDLPVADSMRVLGVTLDRRLTFDNHASTVARSCNYHARAIRHIRHWPCWRSRLSRRHTRSIWTSTSRCAPAHATLDRHPSHCCACHFDGHHSPDNRSALPHLWLGTHCHLLC